MGCLAWFISGHGYGHAARALAVMDQLAKRQERPSFIVVSDVNPGFLDSHPRNYPILHFQESVDVGFVQLNAFEEDIEQTVARLQNFYPVPDSRIDRLARLIEVKEPSAVVCDISPVGIAVAQKLGVPSIVVENFTWQFLYRALPEMEAKCQAALDWMQQKLDQATERIHVQPSCSVKDPFAGPVCRVIREDLPFPLRESGMVRDKPTILVTTGGFQSGLDLQSFLLKNEFQFVVMDPKEGIRNGILHLQPENVYFPNLVFECDAIIGKCGYSTASEAFQANTAFGFLPRPGFAESEVIESFLIESGLGMEFSRHTSHWNEQNIRQLLQKSKPGRSRRLGAVQVAERIIEVIA